MMDAFLALGDIDVRFAFVVALWHIEKCIRGKCLMYACSIVAIESLSTLLRRVCQLTNRATMGCGEIDRVFNEIGRGGGGEMMGGGFIFG
jgi:hypothetical protein